ncbi:hypothetical protein DNX92_23150 [Salmonella enterica subsp. enterica]|nr:hypothetical protein [Salmonella enterica subsp. enterica serovar Richmond]
MAKHQQIIRRIRFTVIVSLVFSSSAHLAYATGVEAKLTPQQVSALNALIDKQVTQPGDREIIAGWTEAQRVAEFICRPALQKEIRRQFPAADKTILDQGTGNQHHLESPSLLTGNGQFRTGIEWTRFNYRCELTGSSGMVKKVHIVSLKQLTP